MNIKWLFCSFNTEINATTITNTNWFACILVGFCSQMNWLFKIMCRKGARVIPYQVNFSNEYMCEYFGSPLIILFCCLLAKIKWKKLSVCGCKCDIANANDWCCSTSMLLCCIFVNGLTHSGLIETVRRQCWVLLFRHNLFVTLIILTRITIQPIDSYFNDAEWMLLSRI